MLKVENRESAHIRSRVKDLSVVPNIASYNGLFACITPIAKTAKNADGFYEPILVRDTETLIANFGDPRIDPEKYIDLYSVMKLVANGGTCYVAKVDSGDSGVYQFPFLADPIHSADVAGIFNEFTLYTGDDEPAYTYHCILENKRVVTSVIGYTAADATKSNNNLYTSPFKIFVGSNGVIDTSNEEITLEELLQICDSTDTGTDYAGAYTWKCVRLSDGTFDLRVTFSSSVGEALADIPAVIPSDPPTPSPHKVIILSNIDENWGSEPLKFTRLESTTTSPNPLDDDTTKVSSLVFETAENIENEYVITGFKYWDSSLADPEFVDGLPTELTANGVTYDTELVNHKLRLTFKVPYVDGAAVVLSGILPANFIVATKSTRKSHAMIAYSSMAEDLSFSVYLSQVKPYSIHAYYLNIEVLGDSGTLGSVKIKLEDTTTNQGIVNALNSVLGTLVRFELLDSSTASACGVKELGANSIAQAILDKYCGGGGDSGTRLTTNPQNLEQPIAIELPLFEVNVDDYINALLQYKAKKYIGCLTADLVCPVTRDIETSSGVSIDHDLYPLNCFDRRTLHYNLKDIAFERKDTTVILSTPYTPSYDNLTAFEIQDACEWVSSQGAYADLWEYGQGATTDYATQSFYLEIYYSWLKMQCDWIVNGVAKSKFVKVAPSNLVINNILTSWRDRGIQYPVAGDQGGILPETCSILKNPKTKLERDQLIQYRINPIWDTGTRGIQIFGNETLNAGYTDLNAAHIARTLVYIRSAIDEYTEKLKFSINNLLLWDKWKTYVTQYILEPLLSVNAISEYEVAMGEDTTSKEEIANRTINGIVRLIFYQSAEVFDLSYIVYSSSTTIEEASSNS